MTDPLEAVSPLDGRYAGVTRPLREFVSESALMRERTHVEVEYLIALAELDALDLDLDEATRERLRESYQEFDLADAREIKRIETEGSGDRPATNHDVKAIEYWLRDRLTELDRSDVVPWVHFGLTSEDVNNIAYRLLLRDACETVLVPALRDITDTLHTEARTHHDLPMPARTHGQSASPTTYGKELAIAATRLDREIDNLQRCIDALEGKLGGATGTYAAHHIALPTVDWPGFARSFIEGFNLTYLPLTTQVNPSDDLARMFDSLSLVNTILLDFDRDMWRYISDGYLVQSTREGEVGSSTMPHKVNPIDFENSEGNLSKARSELRFLAEYLPESRLQRDLSDSTVKRTIGAAFAHCLIGYRKTADGLTKVQPDSERMTRELEEHPEVLAEAFQTALRRIGDRDAYERVKDLTRGVELDEDVMEALIAEIEAVDPELGARLSQLTPDGYTGLAGDLVNRFDTS